VEKDFTILITSFLSESASLPADTQPSPFFLSYLWHEYCHLKLISPESFYVQLNLQIAFSSRSNTLTSGLFPLTFRPSQMCDAAVPTSMS
jgi:hypothetical protein